MHDDVTDAGATADARDRDCIASDQTRIGAIRRAIQATAIPSTSTFQAGLARPPIISVLAG